MFNCRWQMDTEKSPRVGSHHEKSEVYFKDWVILTLQPGRWWTWVGTRKMILLGIELQIYWPKKSEACLEGNDPRVLSDMAEGPHPLWWGSSRLAVSVSWTFAEVSKLPFLLPGRSPSRSHQPALLLHTCLSFPVPLTPPPGNASFNYPPVLCSFLSYKVPRSALFLEQSTEP